MPRRRTLAIVALGLILAVAPVLPDSDGPDGALSPTGQGPTGEGPSADQATRPGVSPELQAEIDRVVAAGQRQPAYRSKTGPALAVRMQVRCATFETLRYCLHVGWTDATETEVQARVLAAVRRTTSVENTGDLDTMTVLSAAASLSSQQRAVAERDELTRAALAVGKVWSIRHDIEGVPYPTATAARVSASASPTAAPGKPSGSPSTSASPASAASSPAEPKTEADYPRTARVLDPTEAFEQKRSYWCGPTAMQTIAWGWSGERLTQNHWAKRLGTTGNGTGIESIVRVVNDDTGWDRKNRAGPYITLDISRYSYNKWYLLLMRHIHDYRAPVVLHPILLKKYFPYLDDDASGHYQVGRGYNKRGVQPNSIGYLEPWNQQRFDPSEPFISRVQWRSAYKSYRANRAHPFHNIGV